MPKQVVVRRVRRESIIITRAHPNHMNVHHVPTVHIRTPKVPRNVQFVRRDSWVMAKVTPVAPNHVPTKKMGSRNG